MPELRVYQHKDSEEREEVMSEERAKSEHGIDWYVVAVLWAILLAFLIAIATGCQTCRGIASDTRALSTALEQAIVPSNVPEKEVRIIYVDPNN